MSVPPPTPDQRVPRLLAGLGALLLAMLAWRAYSPQFTTRPTELVNTAKAIDVNAADKAALLQIPGVGEHMANAILAERQQVGRFESLEELERVRGIGGKTLDKLRPWLAIGPGSPNVIREEPAERLERKKPAPAPAKPTATAAKPAPEPGEIINVNTASAEDLRKLPGLGPKLVEAVIQERTREKFKSVEDMHRVRGIGPKTMEKLRPFVKFD